MVRIGLLLVVLSVAPTTGSSQTLDESSVVRWAVSTSPLQKLTASDASLADGFGHSLSVDGNVLAVGARFDDDRGTDAGAVYIFRFDGSAWLEEEKLTASDGKAGDAFGWEVAVSGDVIAVAAPGADDGGTDAGSAYIFRYTGATWVQEQRLFAPDAQARDGFGSSIALDGSIAAIGVPFDDEAFVDVGSAFVFRYNGSIWSPEAKLSAPNGRGADYFGQAIAVQGETLLVGAPYANQPVTDAGSAYSFRYTGSAWSYGQEINLSPSGQSDQFGSAIAIDGDVAVIGAYSSDGVGFDSGAAHIYRFDGSAWQPEQKLAASDAAGGDLFGVAVSISGETVVVGAWGSDQVASNAGAAYVYRFDGSAWQESEKLTAPDGVSADLFGVSVAVDGTTAFAGATGNDQAAVDGGATYVFSVTATSIGSIAYLPDDLSLSTYPDPFSGSAVVTLDIPPGLEGELSLFDAIGRRLTLPTAARLGDGRHAIVFDGRALPTGMYFLRVSTRRAQRTRSIHVVR